MSKLFRSVLLLLLFVAALTVSAFAQKAEQMESFLYLDMPLVVTASKFGEKVTETPTVMYVITAQQIEERGYTNIVEILQEIPGYDVNVTQGADHATVYPRGNQTEIAERTLFFINGVNFQSLFFQNARYSRHIPLSSIERIEFLYGPSSAIYGPDAFCGIVNVITKSPMDLEDGEESIAVDLGGGSFETGYFDFSYLGKMNEDVALTLSGRYFQSAEPDYGDRPGFFSDEIIRNSWLPMTDKYSEYKDPTNDYAIIAKLDYKNLEIGYDRLYFAEGSGPEYPLDKTLSEPQWKDFRNMLYGKYSKDVTADLNVSYLFSFKNGDNPQDSAWPERFDNDGDGIADVAMVYWQSYSEQYHFANDFVYKMNPQVIINGGANLTINDLQKGYVTNWGDLISSTLTAGSYNGHYPNTPEPLTGEDKRYKMTVAGTYLQAKWNNQDETLFIVPGVRYDYNSIYENTLMPRMGVVYKIKQDDLILKANYGEGFQYPSPRNLYGGWTGTIVSAHLRPEKIQSYEVGLLFTLGKIENALNTYYTKIKDTNIQGSNLPDRTSIGAEYLLNYRVKELASNLENLDIFMNLSYIDPKYDEEIVGATRSASYIPNIASIKANIGAGIDIYENLRCTVRNTYAGERKTVVTNPVEKIDAYLVTNINLQYKNLFRAKGLTLSFAINNALDTEYYHPGVVSANAGEDTTSESLGWYSSRIPQPGRNYMLTLKSRF